MPDPATQLISVARRSQILRLLLIGFLALLLEIPVVLIGALVFERQARRDAANEEIASKWGGAQTLTGPALVLPYVAQLSGTSSTGQLVPRSETRYGVVLPDRLHIRGSIDTEIRRRGIFEIPVYTEQLQIEGTFSRRRLSELGIESSAILWDRVNIALGVSHVRAVQSQTALSWNGHEIPFLPGAGGLLEPSSGIHAPVPANDGQNTYAFSFPLVLRGSLGAYFSPSAEETVVELDSTEPAPNFQGAWLPSDRTVSSTGFHAKWTIPFLGRDYPQVWTIPAVTREAIDRARFGVEMGASVDQYRMSFRSVKYALVFILLTFTSVWLIEVLAQVRVHPIQYLLLGAALALFYLLELSLSEHLPFALAYAIASVAVIVMVGAYSFVILGRAKRSIVIGGGVTALYGYLYVLLLSEDYALLIGAIGLFLALGATMLVTRRIDWYAVGQRAGSD